MASRVFFDPVVALRMLPLVSSTCSLLFGWDQSFFLSLLNRPQHGHLSKKMLPSYFNAMFRPGVTFVVTMIAVSFWSGLANLFVRREVLQSRASFHCYLAGAVASLSHLLFIPLVAPLIQDIIEDKEGTDVNERLGRWIRINTRRTLTVDLAAWAAFLIAVGKTVQ